MKKRTCYFIQETVRNNKREFIPCIAVEGELGYNLTDWNWGTDREIAEECAKDKNNLLGISEEDASKIILSTMKSKRRLL